MDLFSSINPMVLGAGGVVLALGIAATAWFGNKANKAQTEEERTLYEDKARKAMFFVMLVIFGVVVASMVI